MWKQLGWLAVAGAAGTLARFLRRYVDITGPLQRELSVVEGRWRAIDDAGSALPASLDRWLRGRRVLYVGGRPSSTPATATRC